MLKIAVVNNANGSQAREAVKQALHDLESLSVGRPSQTPRWEDEDLAALAGPNEIVQLLGTAADFWHELLLIVGALGSGATIVKTLREWRGTKRSRAEFEALLDQAERKPTPMHLVPSQLRARRFKLAPGVKVDGTLRNAVTYVAEDGTDYEWILFVWASCADAVAKELANAPSERVYLEDEDCAIRVAIDESTGAVILHWRAAGVTRVGPAGPF